MRLGVALLILAAVLCVRDRGADAQPDPSMTAPPPPVPAPAPAPTIESKDVTAPAPPPDKAPGIAAVGTCESADDTATRLATIDNDTNAGAPIKPPVAWSDYEVTGTLVGNETPELVHVLLAPTMARHHALTDTARAEITAAIATFGYQLVALDVPSGGHAIVKLAPLPIVRRVKIDLHQGLDLLSSPLDEEVLRRMRLRAGTYLPWKPIDRECILLQEKARLEEYLRDEGFFRVVVKITHDIDHDAVTLKIDVQLGDEYTLNPIVIKDAGGLAVDAADLQALFRHHRNCIVWKLCYGTARFNRTAFTADLQQVVERFHKYGYPAVRVQSDFNRATSPDHVRHTVNITLTIDQRRHLDVQFEGNDPDRVTDEQLKKQLTFDKAGSSDDTEAADSARAITQYLQKRGYFDAHVTWTRERFTALDQIVYRIALGHTRNVKSVEFVGNQALSDDTLADVVATKASKLSSSLFGGTTATTSDELSDDIDRVVSAYRQAGYRDARVSVAAATEAAGVGNAALTAALAAADHGGDLYVRFTIEEGKPTLLTSVEVALGAAGTPAITTPADRKLCDEALAQLAELIGDKKIATPPVAETCIAATGVTFKEDELSKTPDTLRDWMWNHGRPRATVEYAVTQTDAHAIAAHYKLARTDKLKVGRIVVRGNFRTESQVIYDELAASPDDGTPLVPGAPLTATAVADAGRRLRATGLFNDVHLDLPELDTTTEDTVNGVVRVQERYDQHAQIDLEGGYSSLSGWYLKAIGAMKNLLGKGLALDLSGTIGTKIQAVEATFRIPRWLARRWVHFEFQTELTAFYRQQDTPEFGELTTEGITLGFSRSWPRQNTMAQKRDRHPARSITVGLHYDFRLRNRQVDALRPADGDNDQTQVPVSTQTGSIGVSAEWEQRIDAHGALSPLSPEFGFRLEGGASIASPDLLGQDTFLKIYGAYQRYHTFGENLLLRVDLRYDQGVPLGGAVLLPEVERFFAGGDSTVRGYNDDQLAHEIIQVSVPPLGTVSQIRVLPAGGNIRVMGSIDAQVRMYKLLASAVFFDVGTITNQWSTWTTDQLRPAIGIAFLRAVTPFGAFAFEYAIPLVPELGDDPRGRFHLSFAARGSF